MKITVIQSEGVVIEKLPRERNVVIGDVSFDDIELFFGPLQDNDVFIQFHTDATFDDIASVCGIFRSKTQARKNGWDKDIPEGFWDKERIGKLNRRLTILKVINNES